MTDKDISELVELLYPFIIKKIKEDNSFKNCIRSTNATVSSISASSNRGEMVGVKFPYDKSEVEVLNKSTEDVARGDLVCIHYYIDLKNAYIAQIAKKGEIDNSEVI